MQNKKSRVRWKGDEKNFVYSSGYWDCDEKFYSMISKSLYPYESMGSRKKFEEAKLPLKNAFSSKLSMKGISDKDHAQ